MPTVPIVAGTAAEDPPAAAAPKASRLGRPSWLDPRLVAGILLIVAALLGGARVVSGAGHTTPVWSLRHDLAAGSAVTAADLTPTAVHFGEPGAVDRYLPAGSALPAGAHLTRSIDAGELLPRSAVSARTAPTVALALSVASGDLPPGLSAGTVVDVWAVPDRTSLTSGAVAPSVVTSPALELLRAVGVSAVTGSGALGTSGTTVVTVSIPRDDATVATVLGQAAGRSIVVLPVTGAVDGGAGR